MIPLEEVSHDDDDDDDDDDLLAEDDDAALYTAPRVMLSTSLSLARHLKRTS